jgi:hypothetical protein
MPKNETTKYYQLAEQYDQAATGWAEANATVSRLLAEKTEQSRFVEAENAALKTRVQEQESEFARRTVELGNAIALLREMRALIIGECPALLDEDRGGLGELDLRLAAFLACVALGKDK